MRSRSRRGFVSEGELQPNPNPSSPARTEACKARPKGPCRQPRSGDGFVLG